ncbi:hypothetical protein FN846DRAFT_995892 [Sphaerosporella brunnea]|uniref:Uncharacterized protein n=1 Tax=Sphaerosporella brunnea TaxID=1250544 RepID=A0A5J5EJU2_9PEZI|nr:hypothetical protein FN846DRAFT_995892 [Sphaerosporella brunnea]
MFFVFMTYILLLIISPSHTFHSPWTVGGGVEPVHVGYTYISHYARTCLKSVSGSFFGLSTTFYCGHSVCSANHLLSLTTGPVTATSAKNDSMFQTACNILNGMQQRDKAAQTPPQYGLPLLPPLTLHAQNLDAQPGLAANIHAATATLCLHGAGDLERDASSRRALERAVAAALAGPPQKRNIVCGARRGQQRRTFKCPPAGRVAFEVASAVKAECSGGGMNIGGQSGLGIEILGVESEWW